MSSSYRRNSNNGNSRGSAPSLTDEDLARALQRQYEREFRESQQQQQQPPRLPSSSLSSAARQSGVTVAEQRSRASSSRASTTTAPVVQSSSRQNSQRQYPPPPPPPPPPAPPPAAPAVTNMSDEEYSRSLMLEEERARAAAQRALSRRQQSRDERRSQQQLQQQTIVVIPSAPLEETQSMRMRERSGGSSSEHGRRGSATLNTSSNNNIISMSDADLARQMMAEEARKSSKNNSHHHHPYGVGTTPLTSRESSLVSQEIDDEELAMRLQQEMRDEEIARQIQTSETDRVAAQNAQRLAELQQQQQLQRQQAPPPKRGCTARRVCSFTTSTLILGAAAAVMVYYFLIMGNDLPDWIPAPEDFADVDPFDAKDPSEANTWENDNNGIALEVLNALDDYWHPYFNQAVQDWDNGYPDSLTLVTSVRQPETDCTTVNGKVKVCNGNYGNTHWKGINEVLIDRRGMIFASSARMNEYYLGAPGDPDQMQYTMCHEIGHAWGLPHTDESFTNKDLGNCMDYTNNPASNKAPDATNFQFLYALYGLVPGAAPYTPPTQAPVSSPTETTSTADAAFTDEDTGDLENDNGDAKDKDKSERDRDGGRRRRKTRRMAHDDDEPLEDWLQAAVNAAKASLEEMNNHSNQPDADAAPNGTTRGRKWRLLQQAPHGESHEIELEHGYRFQVHKLYA